MKERKRKKERKKKENEWEKQGWLWGCQVGGCCRLEMRNDAG